ncbi:MAG: cystathionine beta-lyase [Alphaproteobacteria bacterium]|nr:cystathionine beta-lyase [Alphaproteobacteria bacterium]
MARETKKPATPKAGYGPATEVIEAGRDPKAQGGMVNPPVYHASTVIFETLEELERKTASPFDGVYYGRFGTPTTFAFEDAVARLEGGYRSIACASGLAAIGASLMAFLDAGDHLLMVDSAYSPTRKYCEIVLKGFGVETTYYDPLAGAEIKHLFRPETKAVFAESPGSLTFEVQDVPAIAAAAHSAGAVMILDNSWATPLYFEPFAHGVDISIQAATKYLVGHSDVMMGAITTTEEHFRAVRVMAATLGAVPGPDDCYLALRGMRTLAVRLERHQQTALELAKWCARRDEVAAILHPAFADCPGHDFWQRDFKGSSGLFSVILDRHYPKPALAAMLDHMTLFKMGYSWGGFESLILPADPTTFRTASAWQAQGTLIRLHAGLEDLGDLICDLEAGLARLTGK